MITIEPPSTHVAAGGTAFRSLRKAELRRFVADAARAAGLEGEVHVLLADDPTLRRLNKLFRKKDKATDVLSFPAADPSAGVAGDLAVSLETAARQASEHGHTLKDEVRILLLHGVLHLAGFDHETDSGEMAAREARLRRKLGLPVGLIQRAQRPAGRAAKRLAGADPVSLRNKSKGSRARSAGTVQARKPMKAGSHP